MYVLDTCVALKWFLPEVLSAEAERVLVRFRDGTDQLLAPELLTAEFGGALTKKQRQGGLEDAQVREIWGDFAALDIETVSIKSVADDALVLSLHHGGTFYDAVFVALARARSCSVLTADGSMARAFSPLGCLTELATVP